MLRIFVTGDNHIGLQYAKHPAAAELISARITAFEGMVQMANREKCDLFVITGDLFEKTQSIAQKDIKTILEHLSAFQGTVVVLPGNHDFYDPDVKVWQLFKKAMEPYDNIMLLTEYKPYELTIDGEKVVLYPALCKTKHSEPEENNLGWIREVSMEKDAAYHIGIAHGAVEGESLDKEGQYFQMKRSELESIPVNVWLMGHVHVPFPKNLTKEYAPCEKILNPGTHVQTDVNCNTEGVCFVVEIGDDKCVRAKKVVSGNLRFYRKNLALTAGKMEEILNRELAEIANNSAVELILTGAVSEEEYEDRHKIAEKALERFVEGTYEDYEVTRLISKALIESEFPETSFSASFLTALLDEPQEAQFAYELLKSLKEGK